MSLNIAAKNLDLTRIVRQAFDSALVAVNSAQAVKNAVRIENDRLFVGDSKFDLRKIQTIYSVALGKAAFGMAQGLRAGLGGKLTGGVISAPFFEENLPQNWQTFVGGHPTPNAESLAAANAAFELLKTANESNSLVIFLISGGGSAMLEMPSNEQITLEDLQTANRILVNCGATIGEINSIRRRISQVKGGGLSQILTKAKSVSLIISDTNDNEAFNVASGPTIENQTDFSNAEILEIVERYDLQTKLPKSVLQEIENSSSKIQNPISKIQNWKILLSNNSAIKEATKLLQNKGFIVKIDDDLIETPIDEGCAELVKTLCSLREQNSNEKGIALISGGEFICPVRGKGIGGRNLESALRTAILFDELGYQEIYQNTKFAALFAGTDGIDGNSPATGAICDETTLERARNLNLDANDFLENSDSYSFFHALNDAIITGTTGTNVRDVRILLAL